MDLSFCLSNLVNNFLSYSNSSKKLKAGFYSDDIFRVHPKNIIKNGYLDMYSIIDSKKVRSVYGYLIVTNPPILNYVLDRENNGDDDDNIRDYFERCYDIKSLSFMCDWFDKNEKYLPLITSNLNRYNSYMEEYLYNRYINLFTKDVLEEQIQNASISGNFELVLFLSLRWKEKNEKR